MSDAQAEKPVDPSPDAAWGRRLDREFERQKERARTGEGVAPPSPYDKKMAVKLDELRQKLDEHNQRYQAQEKAKADAAEAARAEELKAAKQAWAAKQAREDDERILQWHRAQLGRDPKRL